MAALAGAFGVIFRRSRAVITGALWSKAGSSPSCAIPSFFGLFTWGENFPHSHLVGRNRAMLNHSQ